MIYFGQIKIVTLTFYSLYLRSKVDSMHQIVHIDCWSLDYLFMIMFSL